MRIVLTGGRSPLALFFGQKLKQMGHEMYMLEHFSPTFANYTNIFTKIEVIAPPAQQFETFRKEVLSFIERNAIDLLLPINEETLYYGLLQEEIQHRGTSFLIGEQELLNTLHNKLTFITWCEAIGLLVPKSELYVAQAVDFSKQLVKPIYSRFGQSVFFSEEAITTIDSENYIVQEKIEGQQICLSLMLKNGQLISACAYDTNLGIENFASITYVPFEHPKLTQIIEILSQHLSQNGFFSFDFMFDGTTFYPIECNPRLTFGAVLDNERIIAGLLNTPVKEINKRITTSYGIKLLWLGKIITQKNWRKTYPTYLKTQDVLAEAFVWQTWLMLPWVLAQYFLKAKKQKLSITDFVVQDISYQVDKNEGTEGSDE
ncbi:hypothetical protein IGJ55_001988 [Enterococcus sp. AZ170]|uniref:ATP-grasp domain-containing protein n=1 Tax=Enterococcus sp. AZ170 TaxID=2774747 RepID=UPI003D2FFFD6